MNPICLLTFSALVKLNYDHKYIDHIKLMICNKEKFSTRTYFEESPNWYDNHD